MSTTTIAIILIGLFVLLIIFWVIRSRGNTTGHIDTTLTAVGAATEAVEDIVESVTHKAEPSKAPPAARVEQPVKKAPVAKTPVPKSPAKKAPAQKAPPKKAATPKPAAAKAKSADPVAVKTASSAPDNLQQLKGVGPKLAARLTELGITRFDQIAAWGPAEIEKVDAQLGAFQGRITRDYWIDQAGFLAKGDIAGFEAKFGKLDG